MTTTILAWLRDTRRPPETPVPRPAPRAVQRLRQVMSWDGWTTLGLEAIVLLSTIWSVEQAQWVPVQPALTLVVLLALAAAAGFERLRWHAGLAVSTSLVLGILVVAWQTAAALPGPGWDDRFSELALRLDKWWELARTGGISIDPLPFAVLLALLTWVLSYLSTWFVLRRLDMWWGILPAGFALLTNLSYLPESYHGFFLTYLFAAMLLMMRMNLLRLQRGWREQGVRFPRSLNLSFLFHAGWFSLLVVFIAWALPLQTAVIGPMRSAWEVIRAPWADVETEVGRLFSSLPSRKAIPLHSFGRAMPFRGAIDLGNEVALLAQTDHPGYWRAKAYDVYSRQGWLVGERQLRNLADASLRPRDNRAPAYAARKTITQRVEVNFSTDTVFAQGQPLEASIPVLVEMASPSVYVLSLGDRALNQALPFDLRRLAGVLRQTYQNQRSLTRDDILRSLPRDVRLQSVEGSDGNISAIHVVREDDASDVVGLRSPTRAVAPRRYEVVSSVSVASARELRVAGTFYPGWVLDRYLQTPSTLPDRVRRLAREVTRDASTAYDRAVAIETYLRTIPYATDIQAPPPDSDGVDHFLFYLRRGYSDYHASAMVVLLRSIGIPARLAAGYATGQWDDQTKAYIVRERHAHAWPEVFFPGYGWVEFEPTPGHEVFPRGEQTADDAGDTENPADMGDLYLDEEFFGGAGSTSLSDFRDGSGPWNAIARVTGVTLLVALLALAAIWVVWLWSFRGLRPAVAAYEKMVQLAGLSGIVAKLHETPSEYARTLTGVLPSQKNAIQEITRGYERSQFGRQALKSEEEAAINAAWRAIRTRLLRRVLRRI
ncbi:MAG: DUF4129 domain-containing protein [Chloroflexi bacterium]|nr:DUF4129 domain-containing protein [Chloroflexota bacterium]